MKSISAFVALLSLASCTASLLYAQMSGSQQEGRNSNATMSADEILQASDQGRNGWDSFAFRTTIQNYVNDLLKEEGLFEVNTKGVDKTLVKFLNADVKGQYLLMVDDDMCIYMPNTRKPIRITPLQRLMGDASNGDVARTHYAQDYAATLKGEETIDGVACYVLKLSAKRDGATYKKIDYWVTRETKRPKKAEIFLTSGKLYKTIHFDTYEEIQNRLLLTQMTIVDRLREHRTTVMKFSSYAPKELPEKYFNKDYLEKLK